MQEVITKGKLSYKRDEKRIIITTANGPRFLDQILLFYLDKHIVISVEKNDDKEKENK